MDGQGTVEEPSTELSAFSRVPVESSGQLGTAGGSRRHSHPRERQSWQAEELAQGQVG